MNTTGAIAKELKAAYKRLGNWQAVGDEYGVTKATAHRVAHGHEPPSPRIRAVLHLPALIPAPMCPKCGVVHIKRCPTERKPRRARLYWFEKTDNEAAEINRLFGE